MPTPQKCAQICLLRSLVAVGVLAVFVHVWLYSPALAIITEENPNIHENQSNENAVNAFSTPVQTNTVDALGTRSNPTDVAERHSARETKWHSARETATNTPLKGPAYHNLTSTQSVRVRIVTGVTRNHFAEVVGVVATAQQMYPGVVIYVTDLIGDLPLEQIAMIKSWCNAEYRRFSTPRLEMEKQRKILTNCAWKPILIAQHLADMNHGEFLIWADASTRFTQFSKRWPREAFHKHVKAVGLVGHRAPGPIALYTHPVTFANLKLLHPDLISSGDILNYRKAVMVGGGKIWMFKSNFLMSKLIKPWVHCAVTESCILPPGSGGFSNRGKCTPGLTGGCHRGDQSVLSILTYDVVGKHAEQTPTNSWSFGPDFPAITERKAYSGPPPTKCNS